MDSSSPRERLRYRASQAAAVSSPASIKEFLRETANEVLVALAQNPHLQEDDFLRLLARKDLPPEAVRELAHHPKAQGNYSVQLALARHPRTPRRVSLPILKFLYLFDCLRVAQTPAVPSDVRAVAEETILKKVGGVPRGERISLAKRGTGRAAAALLMSADKEIIRAALENPYLTEVHLLKILAREDIPPEVVAELAGHGRWSHRYGVRLALIRNPHTPLIRVLTFLPEIALPDLRGICCLDRRLPALTRKYVEAHCQARSGKQR